MHSRVCALLLLLAALLAGEQPLSAQYAAASNGAPRFFVAGMGDAAPVRTDPSRVSVLRSRISLDLAAVTLETALDAISGQSGVRIAYSRAVVPLYTRVSLSANDISIAAALTEVLLDTGVDVLISRTSQITLTPRELDPVQQVPGTIAGRVTEAETGAPIVNAQIAVDGRGRALTNDDGRYSINGVEPGHRTVSVTSIGYARISRELEVGDSATVTVDFALDVSASQLDQIVVTVTGEQRRRELGHVVGRINADSVVREAPVTSLSQLLTGRVPGLQVFQAQGTVGGQVNLRIRGPNSLLLSSEPIVIVDGVRYTSRPAPLEGLSAYSGVGAAERTSPLNDLNVNDVESIEVVKGPSAATLYGTDASNGVLVITTKRGRPGPARWNVYTKGSMSTIPTDRIPEDIYWAWQSTDGEPSLTSPCSLVLVARGICTQDSISVLRNPLKDPELSILQPAPAWEYGANVSGGGSDLRYYFSGDYSQAIGAVRMPPAIASQLLQQRGVSELPDEMQDPNTLRNVNLRGNVSARLGEHAELRVQTGYTTARTRSLLNGSFGVPYIYSLSSGFAPNNPYGRYSGSNPAEAFAQSSTESNDRFFLSLGADWQATSWLNGRLTVGQDISSRRRLGLLRRGDAPWLNTGYVSDIRSRQLSTTAELGATAVARGGRLSSRTSFGAQYVRTVNDGLNAAGLDLRPGGTSISDAAEILAPVPTYGEAVTLGSYVEQTVGLNERLYLTGALRIDGASTFGQGYDAALYPKLSASWIASEEPFFPRVPGIDELRIRYAYGASGQQPPHAWSHPSFEVNPASVRGSPMTVVGVEELGNPLLRPERVREHEIGFDAAGFQNRVQLELTWYRRRTMDQIVSMPLPPGLGSIYTNLGLTTQHGLELELRAALVETPSVSWNVAAQHGLHRTKLVDLGDASDYRLFLGGYAEGYPLGARFRYGMTYTDANGDGLINPYDPAEMTQDLDNPVYMGEGTPPRSQTLATNLSLLHKRLRVSALIERRSGFTQINSFKNNLCPNYCREGVDPSTPLAEIAEVAMRFRTGAGYAYMEPGDFTRLREVTVSLDLPEGVTRALHVRSATVTAAGRNLALWSGFSGPDPESAAVGSNNNPFRPAVSAGQAIGLPQARSWMLRLDLGW